MRIQPAKRLRGHLPRLPGDKSVSHRAAIIAALARGPSQIRNYSTSADCAATLGCLAQLGVPLERDGSAVRIEGVGAGRGLPTGEDAGPRLRQPARPLDCGNSGTTMRLLAGVVAAQAFSTTLTGDASLSARPMQRIIEPLTRMGARITSAEGHAPLVVEGRRPLSPLRYEMPVASAQVKSCVLLAGLGAHGRTEVVEPLVQTRDHTERMLQYFGAPIELGGPFVPRAALEAATARVEGPGYFSGRDYDVPGDISSAAFLIAAATLLPGSDLSIAGVGVNPTRTLFLDAFRSVGDISFENWREPCNEPVADLHVRGLDALREIGASSPALSFRGTGIAQIIDEVPMLAVFGTQVEGGLEIRDAEELRLKESDRIRATVENLRAMGAAVEEYEDGLKVGGRTPLRGARLDAYGDHRIAMAFTVAALVAEGESEIAGASGCVGVSFPEFFDLLETLTER